MADSPAKRHVQRVLAAQKAAGYAGDQLMPGTGIYEQMLLQLASDRGRLKQIQSVEAKAQLKAQLLPTYAPYLEGILTADNGGADDVVTTVMLWSIDAGLIAEALTIADYVLRHNLPMPDRFERTTGCVVAEEVADVAIKALKTEQLDFSPAVVDQALAITAAHDMPDQVRAKLFVAQARWLLHSVRSHIKAKGDEISPEVAADVTAAIEGLRRAIQLDEGCGGKKDLEGAERLLKKHAAQPNG